MQGILLVDKPIGWTSFDAVAKVRGIVASTEGLKPSQVKVGHSGTLDPLATGLLLLLIGKTYTRLATEFTKLDKEYLVTMRLGAVTPSGDLETEAEKRSSYKPGLEEVSEALKLFRGDISQRPPDYSALKVKGQRAYKLARAGKSIELEPRPVTIYSLKLLSYTYPELKLHTKVSSGTYIRSLVVDLGEKLNTGAYMSGLSRTTIGDFNLEDSLKMSDLSYDLMSEKLFFVWSIE